MSGPREGDAIRPGMEIGGFVIEAVAGRGGMGVVYRARQTNPDRVVAIKAIAPAFASDPLFRARFQRESMIAAQIEHPNVIPVHAVGAEGDVLFIAMRFVEGTDLRALIAHEGRLEPRRAATIVDQVAHALDAAHSHGLVHRDVKPANVLIATVGGHEHVYLTDFGLSRHVEGSQAMTQTGAFLGTIDYVAPEQARGERIDSRTDVYALGCLLFHALTGTVPFPLDNDLAKLFAHGTQKPPSLRERVPDVPVAFEAVVARAMAKAPDDRYLSAGDLGRAALAAASDSSLSRAERSVAISGAAPHEANAVPARPSSSSTRGDATQPTRASVTEPPDPGAAVLARRLGERRRPIIGGALVLLALAVVVIVIALSNGGGTNKAVRGAQTRTAHTLAAVGIVPGRSIGPVSLGEARAKLTQTLVGSGYTAKPGSGPNETDFAAPTAGNIVAGFGNGQATYIQKYNDPTIKIGNVSISSTPRAATAALPDWHSLRCPKNYTFLISPDRHTYFELAHDLDTDNSSGTNGIVITTTPVDRSFC